MLSCILLLAFAIRLLGINQPFNEDELHWAYSAEARDWFGTVTFNTPLSVYLLNTFTLFFGVSTETIRLSFVIIGVLTIFITAKLAQEPHNERTALIAAFLLAINPLHVLASLQAAYEGSVLTLFFATTLLFLQRYVKEQTTRNLILTGTMLGLSILSKLTALFILPIIIFFYIFTTKKDVINAVIQTTKITAISVIYFTLFFALPSVITQSPALINSILKLLSPQAASSVGITTFIIQYSYAFLWIGPLVTFLPLVMLKVKGNNKLHFIVIITTLLFYLILTVNTTPPIERYWMILLPSLTIMCAEKINNLIKTFSVNRSIIFLLITTISFIIALMINILEAESLPFYPKQQYINNILSLKLNFPIPITGSSGPLGFYINALNPVFFTLVAFLLFLFMLSGTKYRKIALLSFLSIGVGYQLFFIQEHLISLTQPNIPQITKQTLNYINKNTIPEPIYYFKNYALFYHFDKQYFKNKQPLASSTKFDYFDRESYNMTALHERLARTVNQSWYPGFVSLSFGDDNENQSKLLLGQFKKEGGTVVFIDFPKLNKQGPLWNTINRCDKIKIFSDKNKEVGYIFDCTQLKTNYSAQNPARHQQ